MRGNVFGGQLTTMRLLVQERIVCSISLRTATDSIV
jgi:hypothetical protein